MLSNTANVSCYRHSDVFFAQNLEKKTDHCEIFLGLKNILVGTVGYQFANEHLNKIMNSIEYCHDKNYLSGSKDIGIQFRVFASIKNHLNFLLRKKLSPFQTEIFNFVLTQNFQAVQDILNGNESSYSKLKCFQYGSALEQMKEKLGLQSSNEMYDYVLLDMNHFFQRPEALKNASLPHADFSGVNLTSCDLSLADLRHADMRFAELDSANFQHAQLEGVSMTASQLCVALCSGGNFGHDTQDVILRVIDHLSEASDVNLLMSKLFNLSGKETVSLLQRLQEFSFSDRAFFLEMLCGKLLDMNFVPQDERLVSLFKDVFKSEKDLLDSYPAIRKFMNSLDAVRLDHVVIDIG